MLSLVIGATNPCRTQHTSGRPLTNAILDQMLGLLDSDLLETRLVVKAALIVGFLKDLLHRLGYDSSQYNTHSLRIGAATPATLAGLPPSTIQ
eukprot:Em0014g161a